MSAKESPSLPLNWYAIYVHSRAEKKVHTELTLIGIESFLPLQRKLRQWSDRKKWVEIPLISGYVFVRITRKHYDTVLQIDNVMQYVRFEGKAAIIRDQDIEILKRMLGQSDLEVEITSEELQPGMLVEIIAGPMMGVKGELVSFRGNNKVALRIPPLGFTVLVESPEKNLVVVK
ncbi:MAG: UpxY family transcription antiterminator [Bacteroidetes bacterium]|nr:UpxY family transcription antiterminator [Bacteroidota bacterium]MCL6102198.1 UpxY family transcription antiterminator [Bacteroidota bacterium]